jgi:hypothetical protein
MTIIIDLIDGTDHETEDAREIDTWTESDLQTGDVDGVVNGTFVIGEMIPERGIEGAARTLLTHTRAIEVMKIEIGSHELEAQELVTFVLSNLLSMCVLLIISTSLQNPMSLLGKPTRKRRQNVWPSWRHGRRR